MSEECALADFENMERQRKEAEFDAMMAQMQEYEELRSQSKLWRYFRFQKIEEMAEFMKEATLGSLISNCSFFHADKMVVIELAAPGIEQIDDLAKKWNGSTEAPFSVKK